MTALSRIDGETSAVYYSLAMLLLGYGFGNTTQVLVLAAQNAVERKDIGVATSTATFMRQMGGTFGIAVFGSVLIGTLTSSLAAAFPKGPPAGVSADRLTGSPAVIQQLPDAAKVPVIDSFINAIQTTFTWAIPVLVAAFILSLFLKDIRLADRDDVVATAEESATA